MTIDSANTLRGGCQCKRTHFEFQGPILTCYVCHCLDCQSASGSAFSMSLIAPLNALKFSAESKLVDHQVKFEPPGLMRTSCAYCASAMYYYVPSASQEGGSAPELVAVKAGTLEEKSSITPIAHLWVKRLQPWLKLDDKLPQFEEQPSLKKLVAMWKERENIACDSK